MPIKIFTIVIMVTIVFMGFKQGLAMINEEDHIIGLFSKWNFNQNGVKLFGVITLLSTILILFPQTNFLGNFLMAATILFIICLQLSIGDLKDAAIEVPFIIMNLVFIYFQYPAIKFK